MTIMTRDELREFICDLCEKITEVIAALGTDLKRDDEGWIVDTSDLGIAIRELDYVDSVLSRMSFKLLVAGIEEAPPTPFLPTAE